MIVYRELSSLERDLGIKAKKLYAVSNHLNGHYHTVHIPKANGGERKLSVPDRLLKHIQRRINDVLLVHMPISPHATAYHYGSSVVHNAAPHVQQPVVLKLDIYHFFDSIPYSAVKKFVFPEHIYAEPLRILLTMLCYYNDVLPQGAPTSPTISNIIMREFDDTVGHWCAERNIIYTRYCDDMTFSGDLTPADVVQFIRRELRKHGFILNEQKTQIRCAGQQQKITGIVVNQKPSVPSAYRKHLRQEVYYIRKFGLSEHLQRIGYSGDEQMYLYHLIGQANYILQVTPNDKDALDAVKFLKTILI